MEGGNGFGLNDNGSSFVWRLFTSRYALKYPDYVKKIILISPHGAEPKPENYEEKLKTAMKSDYKI